MIRISDAGSNPIGRKELSVHGKVSSFTHETKGILWWRETRHGIYVTLNQYELERLNANEESRVQKLGSEGTLPLLDKITVFLPVNDYGKFGLGKRVLVTFGISPLTDQFFCGTPPIEILKVSPVQ